MQPSIFNVRVPLADRGDVFLMNTFTDAQLIVSREVSDLLDRLGRRRLREHGERRRARSGSHPRRERLRRREPRGRSPQHRELLRRLPRQLRSAARDGTDDAAVQLRVRLLHPGRSRRVQQDRREDVDGDRGARRRLDRGADRRRSAEELRADVLRRRTASQPAGRLLPRRAVVGMCRARRDIRMVSTSSPTGCC